MEIVICEELFDTELLPVEEQAKHWVAFFSTFDKQDKIALRHILSQKQKWGLFWVLPVRLQDITVLDGFNFYLTAFFQNLKREEVTKVKEY